MGMTRLYTAVVPFLYSYIMRFTRYMKEQNSMIRHSGPVMRLYSQLKIHLELSLAQDFLCITSRISHTLPAVSPLEFCSCEDLLFTSTWRGQRRGCQDRKRSTIASRKHHRG